MVRTTPLFSWGSLLCFDKSPQAKDYSCGSLNLVTMVWNTSFIFLIEHLLPQQGIAGLL
jgi:hypothetical protein